MFRRAGSRNTEKHAPETGIRVAAASFGASGCGSVGAGEEGYGGRVGRTDPGRKQAAGVLFQGRKFIAADRQFDLERAEGMAGSELEYPETGKKPAENRSNARRQRSTRFSDSEWDLIRRAAARHGMSPGELVRSSAVAAAEDRLGEPPPATLSKGHAALIEEIYRLVYVMATLDREEMLDAGRGGELDDLIAAARRSMAETMDEGPA